MKKYITLFNKSENKYMVKEVDAVEKNDEFIITMNNNTYSYSKNNVYDKFEVAILVCKERKIKKTIKEKVVKDLKDNGYTEWQCPICKKKYKINKNISHILTIDHKIPLKNFMDENGEDIRLNKEMHKIAWNKDNLRVICKECNQKKGHEDKYIINTIANRRAYGKCKGLQKGKKKKVSFALGKNSMLSDEVKMEIAKKDSRVFNPKTILGN